MIFENRGGIRLCSLKRLPWWDFFLVKVPGLLFLSDLNLTRIGWNEGLSDEQKSRV